MCSEHWGTCACHHYWSLSSWGQLHPFEVHAEWEAAPGVWGLGHVFEDKLYFTKDIVDDSFVPKNRKPKPVSQPAAKPAPKPAPKGKHVQLFKMRRRVGKGFYSTAPDAPDSE